MHIGMIGLGRMGANMVRRIMRGGHTCVVNDRSADAVAALATEGAVAATSYAALVEALPAPRAIWLMVPSTVVDHVLDELTPHLGRGDIVIDGGNSDWRDDGPRATRLASRGVHYVDIGTSGGVWGLERGYCLMVGGPAEAVARLEPVLVALAPGPDAAPPTPSRTPGRSTAETGWLHCGPAGAGHFVKMVHNGIEYGLMAAYAEGLSILRHASITDAEAALSRTPDAYGMTFNVAEIAELWRRGSVVGSWLLDLTADALARQPQLDGYEGHVPDSGEGRWALMAAVDESVPAPVLAAALFSRFSSRGGADFANRVLSAMRAGFGGHRERP